MGNRKIQFITNNEFYHICNRGVDQRNVFLDQYDVDRFYQSMNEFNNINPIGSIYAQSFKINQLRGSTPKLVNDSKLVNILAFCLNPNHYHFILEQVVDGGISEFMRRLGGYTSYFNKKYNRSGVLFQGRFKSVHIDSNEQLLNTSVYVNLNNEVHQLRGATPKLVKSRSSWMEYTENTENNFCKKDIILNQFKNKEDYRKFAKKSLESILERRKRLKEVESFLLE